jgi:hypothetical protein
MINKLIRFLATFLTALLISPVIVIFWPLYAMEKVSLYSASNRSADVVAAIVAQIIWMGAIAVIVCLILG